jgi:N-acylglucosamine-6-phosphate 2-epimerase
MSDLDISTNVRQRLDRGLIVSCQPVLGGPMDSIVIITAMARAAVEGGCHGLRIEGAANVAAVFSAVSVPIVGIIKRDLTDSPVIITPLLADVDSLARAGAQVIAFDATNRKRPVPVKQLIERIHQHGCLAMADASSFEDGLNAYQLGCDYIGSTLSGYTSGVAPDLPDIGLVTQLKLAGCEVIAEGRYNSPELAAAALHAGAFAVTVGSAITRIERISSWYVTSLANVDYPVGGASR